MKSLPTAVTVAGTTRPSIMLAPAKLSSSMAAKSSVVGFIVSTAGIKAPKGFRRYGPAGCPGGLAAQCGVVSEVRATAPNAKGPAPPPILSRDREKQPGCPQTG